VNTFGGCASLFFSDNKKIFAKLFRTKLIDVKDAKNE
jgi:hypothetical protein